jgi:hypothetical protein
MGGDYTAQATQIVNDVVIAIANWSTAIAVASIQWLVAGLGKSSEPDLSVIVPVYDRVLAISLLILGTIVALSLIDSIASGKVTHALGVVPRVVAGAFAAYAGLALVQYVAGYAALLATVWTPDFASLNNLLIHGVAVSNAVVQTGGSGPHVSTFGLIFTAMSVSSLAVMVHLELVVRSALILTVCSFIPLVCIVSIWPRAVGAATTMAEFLLGLFLSKFVAVLLIAAFSPLVVFSALRFTHTQAGSVARSFTGATVSMAPTGKVLGAAGKALRPVARSAQKRLTSTVSRFRSRQ